MIKGIVVHEPIKILLITIKNKQKTSRDVVDLGRSHYATL